MVNIKKLPVLFCLDSGELGRWAGNGPSVKDGCQDSYYYRKKFWFFTKKFPIRNVLDSVANVPIYFTKDGDPAGYKILVSGSDGNSFLADQLGMFHTQNIKRIEEDLQRSKISDKRRDVDAKKLQTGVEETVKGLRRAADFLQTPEKKERERKRLPGMESGE